MDGYNVYNTSAQALSALLSNANILDFLTILIVSILKIILFVLKDAIIFALLNFNL